MRRGTQSSQVLGSHFPLGIVLIAGLVHGLLYVFLIPPWQHYDEPGHFEYAWLMANRPGLPQAGDYDQGCSNQGCSNPAMRREVAASMIEQGFFERLDFRPNLLAHTEPVWIGISQTADPPLYYWLAALPLRLVRSSEVTFQLYLCRLVSLGFFLMSLLAAYGAVGELTPAGHPLRWLAPLTMAGMPAFTDVMTAVNNDAAAVAFFTLFLWAGLRLMRRGFSLTRLVVLAGLAGLCLLTKNTVAAAAPLALLPVLMSLRPRSQRPWRLAVSAALAGMILAGLGAAVLGDAARNWYGPANAPGVLRTASPAAVSGAAVYQLQARPGGTPERAFQWVSTPPEGQWVTLGGWVWASETMEAAPLKLDWGEASAGQTGSQRSWTLGVEPAYFTLTARLPEKVGRLWVLLQAPAAGKKSVTVYFDGLALVTGRIETAEAPVWVDAQGAQVRWAGQAYPNLIANPSFEQAWLRLRPQFDRLLARVTSGSPTAVLSAVGDWDHTGWYYRAAAEVLFRSFWAKFGWGAVSLVGSKPYRLLLGASLAGLLAAVWAAWRSRRRLPWAAVIFLGAAAGLLWSAALLRGVATLSNQMYFPVARYAFPAMLPTLLVLMAGWGECYRYLRRWTRLSERFWLGCYLAGFLALDIFSLYSNLMYYRG